MTDSNLYNNEPMFVARIHNNSLGSCISISSFGEGIEVIRRYVYEQFDRELTADENEILENDYEFHYIEDKDNIWTFSIGMIG